MKVVVNGAAYGANPGDTVDEWLAAQNIDREKVAVEYNKRVLLKENFPMTVLQDGDVLEIVYFVGGG